jgi:multidrug resistance efflux pump
MLMFQNLIAQEGQPKLVVMESCLAKYPRRSQLGFGHAGILQSIFADEGDRVTEGEILAQLKLDEAKARLDLAVARSNNQFAIDEATAMNELAQQAVDVSEDANRFVGSAFPADEIRRRKLELHRSQATVLREKNTETVNKLEASFEKQVFAGHKLYAPFDGFISRRLLSPGTASEGFRAVLEIVDDSTIRVEGYISRSDARVVQVDDLVTVTSGDQTINGKLGFVDIAAQQITKMVRVWVEIPVDSEIREGDDVKASISTSESR